MIKGNKTDSNRPIYISVMIGIISGLILILLLSLILSFVMTVVDFPQLLVSLSATLSFSAGGFLTGVISAKLNKNKGLLIGALAGLFLFLLIALIGLLVAGGGIGTKFLIRFAVTVISSAIGGIIGVNLGSKRNVL